MPWQKGESGNPGGVRVEPQYRVRKAPRSKLLSEAYREVLAEGIPEDIKEKLRLPEDATFAYAIGKQVTLRALGLVEEDKLCFKAITELRETTEGKTPEKIIAAGTNSELAALAQIMKGEPAPPDQEEELEPAENDIEDPSEELD